MKEFYTLKEVAEILLLSEDSVRRKTRAGIIKSTRFGRQYRISTEEFERIKKEGI